MSSSALADPLDRTRGLDGARSRERLESVEAELTELWGHINAATYRFLKLLAEFDRLEGFAAHGLASTVQWLNWQCGVGDVAAREKVRVARALESLPLISDSFRRGTLSYSKVRAMTRVATPEDEHILPTTAVYGTAAHVERHVRKFRWCERRDEAEAANARHRRRYLSIFRDEDGSVVVHAVLPPEVGAVVEKALEAAVADADAPAESTDRAVERAESDPASSAFTSDRIEAALDEIETRSNVSAQTSAAIHSAPADHAPFGARCADALQLLAETFLSRDTTRRGSTAERYQVCVHIDHRLLAQSTAEPRGVQAASNENPIAAAASTDASNQAVDADVRRHCELKGADRPLAIETARRLACDASLVGIVDDTLGEPLNVGRRTRAISPALARALKVRDGGCRFPGCGRTRFTEGHHLVHWADGGETKLSNLVTLCRFHHRLIHEGGFSLQARDDCAEHERFVFRRPDGSRVEPNGRHALGVEGRLVAGAEPTLYKLNRQAGLAIDARTSRGNWLGERFDLSAAIEGQRYCRKYERMTPLDSKARWKRIEHLN